MTHEQLCPSAARRVSSLRLMAERTASMSVDETASTPRNSASKRRDHGPLPVASTLAERALAGGLSTLAVVEDSDDDSDEWCVSMPRALLWTDRRESGGSGGGVSGALRERLTPLSGALIRESSDRFRVGAAGGRGGEVTGMGNGLALGGRALTVVSIHFGMSVAFSFTSST